MSEGGSPPLDSMVSEWFRVHGEVLAAFGVPLGHKARGEYLAQLSLDDRRQAWWQIKDDGASLVYTFEPVDEDEVFFGKETDYFVDQCFQIWRSGGLALVLANLAIGEGDLLVVLDETMEVTAGNRRPVRKPGA